MAVNIPIWPGSGSFSSGSSTPFGFFDSDTQFQNDAPKVAEWCAKRLGYPIVDVELQDINFFTCLEEAANEYSSQVNQYRAKENMLSIQGTALGTDLSDTEIAPNLNGMVSIAKDYGTEALSGGRVTVYTGSFEMVAGQQIYDLSDANVVNLENGSVNDGIVLRRVFHTQPPAIIRYFDPFIGTGLGSQQMLETFGWGNYSPGVSFMMQPMFDDLLRLQAIEFNDQIRRSAYSFEVSNNRIKFFPIPTGENFTKVYFEYILKSDRSNPLKSNIGSISDFSNVPYNNVIYKNVNDVGKQWIRKYALALAKEMLGFIRGKYSSIPIPNAEVTLNGSDLLSAGQTEKEALITELKDTLDTMSRQSQLERKQAESDALQQQMNKIPLKIYIG